MKVKTLMTILILLILAILVVVTYISYQHPLMIREEFFPAQELFIK